MIHNINDILSYKLNGLGISELASLSTLICTRIIVIIHIVPFLGSKNAPPVLRIGLSLVLTFFYLPMISSNIVSPLVLHPISFILLLLKEILIGFCIGFITSQIFYLAEITGRVVDVARAASQIEMLVPELKERSSAFGSLLVQLFIVIFLSTGLHSVFFQGLTDSFIQVPVNTFPQVANSMAVIAEEFITLFSYIFRIGITLAAPVIVICLIVEIGLGLMNRIAPQIDAYFMSLPAKSLAGLAMFLVAFSFAIEQYGIYSKIILEKLTIIINLFV